ncbi:Sodium/solute symporter, partial [Operophtera brumata]
MVVICGLYTVLGGLRAVVWTDSVQTGVMFIGVFLVTVAGTIAVGGVSNIFYIGNQSGRMELTNWDFSPYERQTGWGAIVGGFLYWTCFNSVNQTMGKPLVNDRLLPAFVIWVASVQRLPGLTGVFLAGVFGAGLRGHSTRLAAIASETNDRRHPRANRNSDFGCHLSVDAFRVATALSAIAASATCGIFTLGMVCWWVGPRGAIVGGAAGALVAGTLSLGTQAAAAKETIFPLFRISYHWIAPMGLFTTLFVGALVGWLFDDKDSIIMDVELFTPFTHRWLPSKAHHNSGMARRSRDSGENSAPTAMPLILARINKIESSADESR